MVLYHRLCYYILTTPKYLLTHSSKLLSLAKAAGKCCDHRLHLAVCPFHVAFKDLTFVRKLFWSQPHPLLLLFEYYFNTYRSNRVF